MKTKAVFLYPAAIAMGLGFLPGESTNVWAYVPPTKYILKTAAKKRLPFRGVVIHGKLLGGETGAPTFGMTTRSASYFVNLEEGRGALVVRSGETLNSNPTLVKEIKVESLGVTTPLLFSNSSKHLYRALGRVGVDLDSITKEGPIEEEDSAEEEAKSKSDLKMPKGIVGCARLERFGDRVAWALGLKDQPQVWFEKDGFVPVRAITPKAQIRYEQYRATKEFLFPRLIDIFTRDGKSRLLQFQVSEVEVVLSPQKKAAQPLPFPGFDRLKQMALESQTGVSEEAEAWAQILLETLL